MISATMATMTNNSDMTKWWCDAPLVGSSVLPSPDPLISIVGDGAIVSLEEGSLTIMVDDGVTGTGVDE